MDVFKEPELNGSKSVLAITEHNVQLVEKSLHESFPESSIRILPINSGEDISDNFLQIAYAGERARDKDTVTCLLIKPESELFKKCFSTLDPEAKKYVFLPGGIEQLVDHEKEHFEMARRIKEGTGLVNQLGLHADFLFSLRVLVYPDHRKIEGRKYTVPISHFGTLLLYEDSVSEDERLAINLEIILAAGNSKGGLSPQDKAQVKQIMSLKSEKTPILTGLFGLLPKDVLSDI